MATEAGKEFNSETAQDHREKKFHFVTCGETFRYTLQIPEYILVRLTPTAEDELFFYMHKYATEVVCEALRGGYLDTPSGRERMRRDVGEHLKNYIWEEFSKQQERAGNDCWEVSPLLQKVYA